jgi:AAA+ superfamily predicted ATPase
MESLILFDSIKYLRKIPVIFSVIDENQNTIAQETLKLNRLIIFQTKFYRRILLQTPESDVSNTIQNLQDKMIENKSNYISIVSKPQGINSADAVVCFVNNMFNVFSEVITKSSERVFTTLLEDNMFIVVNETKIKDGIYEEYVTQKTTLSQEEMDFITDTIICQETSDWFPSKKEFIETQKKLNKEKKSIEKKEKGSFLFPKKKENTEVAITTETGEYINPKSLKIHRGSINPDYELNNIIGLDNIKKDIHKMRCMLEYEKDRKQRGIETSSDTTLHMCFMGHPGTGKTTIARIMTGILFSMGYIKNNQCIEISGLDLQGGYVGQTAIITKQIVDMAKGGILFIDEAYALCENKDNSYGAEAVSVLLKEMEDNRGDLIVIFAGYEDDMNKFLNVNPGFRSRINKYFQFTDYTTIELGKIFLNYTKQLHLKVNQEVFTKCIELFKEAKKHPNFSNGRFVRNLTEKIEEEHILNTVNADDKRMDIITIDDLPDTVIESLLYGM